MQFELTITHGEFMSNNSRKKFVRPKVSKLDYYKIDFPIESNVQFRPFEYDEIVGVQNDEKNSLRTKNMFEAADINTFILKFNKTEEKFENFVDSVALLYDKGVKLGKRVVMRGQKYEFPDGKEYTQFLGFVNFQNLVTEEELREKVIPLYENVKQVQPRVRLCLTWFNRGLCESQDLDKFLNYWISLEALTPLNIEREKPSIQWEHVDNAITELKLIRHDGLSGQLIQNINRLLKFKSIPEAMADELSSLINDEEKIVKILSPLGESDLKKVLRQLQHERSQIAHGEWKRVQEIEKKVQVLHDLSHEVLIQKIRKMSK